MYSLSVPIWSVWICSSCLVDYVHFFFRICSFSLVEYLEQRWYFHAVLCCTIIPIHVGQQGFTVWLCDVGQRYDHYTGTVWRWYYLLALFSWYIWFHVVFFFFGKLHLFVHFPFSYVIRSHLNYWYCNPKYLAHPIFQVLCHVNIFRNPYVLYYRYFTHMNSCQRVIFP